VSTWEQNGPFNALAAHAQQEVALDVVGFGGGNADRGKAVWKPLNSNFYDLAFTICIEMTLDKAIV